jgi:heme/copper-type cytochrome/quinol oxidase subunit 4
LYELKFTTYNPKLAILLGLIENVFILGMMFYFNNAWIYLFLFCFVNLFLKIIPFWRLRRTAYHTKDAYALLIYFIIFLLWIYVNDKFSLESYKKLKQGKPIGPFTYYIGSWLGIPI